MLMQNDHIERLLFARERHSPTRAVRWTDDYVASCLIVGRHIRHRDSDLAEAVDGYQGWYRLEQAQCQFDARSSIPGRYGFRAFGAWQPCRRSSVIGPQQLTWMRTGLPGWDSETVRNGRVSRNGDATTTPWIVLLLDCKKLIYKHFFQVTSATISLLLDEPNAAYAQ